MHAYIYMQTYMHPSMHACIQENIHICMGLPACMHTCERACSRHTRYRNTETVSSSWPPGFWPGTETNLATLLLCITSSTKYRCIHAGLRDVAFVWRCWDISRNNITL